MDDFTFQQQLSILKDRVSEMAVNYQPSPFPRPAPTASRPAHDAFCYQLDDVKLRLHAMQTSLNYFMNQHDGRQQQSMPYLPQRVPLESNNLALPSGPLFWQLFTSLRTDVRGLDSRVATLEQDVSDLEDRVDRIQPQFTPTASDVNQWDHAYGPTSLPAGAAELPFECMNQLEDMSWFKGHSQHSSYTGPSPIQHPMQHQALGHAMPIYPASEATRGHLHSVVAPESVKFRDREIDQLEELMRETQERLGRSEDLVKQRDANIAQLERTCGQHESRILAYENALQECQSEIANLRADKQAKDATVEQWSSKQRQAFLRKQAQLSAANRQTEELQRSVYELQQTKEEANEIHAAKDREIQSLRQICEAKEDVGCQQEQIIARGAKLIEERDRDLDDLNRRLKLLDDDHRNEVRERARFARLVEERDEEISQLRASLTHALMPRSVLAESRKDKSPNPSNDGKKEAEVDSSVKDSKIKYGCSPFAIAGAVGPRGPSNAQWAPTAFRDYSSKLPHEIRRASLWGSESNGVHTSKFGVPSAMSPTSSSSRASEEQKRDLRRSDSLKLLQRLAIVEEGSSQPGQSMTDVPGRHRLPLDRPPLPAPLTPPRKMASAELGGRRSRVNDGMSAQISRHRSLQEIPGRRFQPYQPYVEDGESGGV